jgi:hypothetical protein
MAQMGTERRRRFGEFSDAKLHCCRDIDLYGSYVKRWENLQVGTKS